MTQTQDNSSVAGRALALSLDQAGEAAFLRLAKGLPVLCASLMGLSDDLYVVPTVKAASEVEVASYDLGADLDTVAGQITDPATRARFEKARDQLAVPQVVEQESRFKVIPVEQAKFAIFDTLTSKRRGTFDDEPSAHNAMATLDVANTLQLSFVEKSAEGTPREERTVFGVVLEPETVDSQGDIYSEDEIRKTAFKFMEQYQRFGLMHKQLVPSILPLESFLAPCEMTINGQKVKKGTWLLRVRVLDDLIWKNVRTGKLTGFSIGGSAIRTPETLNLAA